MGTVVVIRLNIDEGTDPEQVEREIGVSFDLLAQLENQFSKFVGQSDVSRLNQVDPGAELPVSREFARLTPLAAEVWRTSGAGFDPFGISVNEAAVESPLEITEERGQYFARRKCLGLIDYSGIAKGFAVDVLITHLSRALPSASGVVNAGGDLRFFNTAEASADIRLATDPPRLRRLDLIHSAIATSTLREALDTPESTTEYRRAPRPGLSPNSTVSVVADTCAVADALTKVGWFGKVAEVEACARKFSAEILVFGDDGELSERYPRR